MHLSEPQARHIAPALWPLLTDEEKHAACKIDLATLNAASLTDADYYAELGNPIAAAYIVRLHDVKRLQHEERIRLCLTSSNERYLTP